MNIIKNPAFNDANKVLWQNVSSLNDKDSPRSSVSILSIWILWANICFNDQRQKKTLFICSQFSRRLHDNMVVRERSLGKKLKKISKDAKLSKTYTNNSIRATAVCILDRSCFEARHIMAVSGPKNESSIRSYCKMDMSRKREMSSSLSTECVVAGQELRDLGHHKLSPVLSLSQEEFIMQNTHTENTKTFNFHNCSVDFLP